MLNKFKFSLFSATVVFGIAVGHNQLPGTLSSVENNNAQMIAALKPPEDAGCSPFEKMFPNPKCSPKKVVRLGGGNSQKA